MNITNGAYVVVIDKGECCSTLHKSPRLVVWNNAKYSQIANKDVWAKYNFYPSNGTVGEIVDKITVIFSEVYILKVNDDIYVPMTEKGIKVISKDEWLRKRNQ